MGKLQIDMLGVSFAVQAGANDAHLQKLLSYYKEITDTIQKNGVQNSMQTSIIAGITLVDELYKEKEKTASLQKQLQELGSQDIKEAQQAEELTLKMISDIDKALS